MSRTVQLPPLGDMAGSTILRLPQVLGKVQLSRSSVYAGVKTGTFPAPVKLGERAVGWLASSIDAWIQSRAQAVRPGASA